MQLVEVTLDSEEAVCDVLAQIFTHIKSVQEDIARLNLQSMEKINDLIFNSGVEVDEKTFVALQHQDILTQQLNAVGELSEMLQKHLENFDNFETLESKFLSALEIAKAKKEAYRGNAF
ncbi:MAG: hypothetical protein DSZ05_09630 [Sulfurospirillum sp.]|nr:MAG: hypothetical protein DSZ05_09630 [Sulfurospirillum sp.]